MIVMSIFDYFLHFLIKSEEIFSHQIHNQLNEYVEKVNDSVSQTEDEGAH